MHRVMSSPNEHKLTSSFAICITFISLSSLIAWAKTSSTALSKMGSGHAWSRSLFTGKCFDVSIPPVDLLYAAFIRLRYCLILLVFSELLS